MDQDDGKGGQLRDQGDSFHFPGPDDGDAAKALGTTLRAKEADQPVQDTAGGRGAAPLLHDDVAPPPPLLHAVDTDIIPPPPPLPAVQVRTRLLAVVRALLREAPAAFAVAVAYCSVADDGDLGLAAWARHGVIYPALLVAGAAAVRAASVLAGARRLVAHLPARACLLALLREAPATFAIAAAYGLRPVDALRDILVVILALAAALAAIYFP